MILIELMNKFRKDKNLQYKTNQLKIKKFKLYNNYLDLSNLKIFI